MVNALIQVSLYSGNMVTQGLTVRCYENYNNHKSHTNALMLDISALRKRQITNITRKCSPYVQTCKMGQIKNSTNFRWLKTGLQELQPLIAHSGRFRDANIPI